MTTPPPSVDGRPGPPEDGAAGRPPPPQVRPGLLDHIAADALDADYAEVAARRAASDHDGATSNRSRRSRIATALVLLAFATLLSVAAVQTARGEPAREASTQALVERAEEARTALDNARDELSRLRREVAVLQRSQLAGSEEGRALQARMRTLSAATGTRAVTGPGMEVTVDDATDARSDRERVLDSDLQRLVNGLWQAGAEAISINGQRLTQLSAIRTAGEAITVNFKPLRPPYVVAAIGDPDQLPARFIETRGGSWWLNLRSVYDVRFEMNSREELTLPALRIDDLRLARVPEEAE